METVDILSAGYVGKDVDGFDKWVVEGKGEGFAMKGSFYNEQDYNNFVEANTKIQRRFQPGAKSLPG